MLSVIVPIYNVEKYLVKCIESIINQQYKQLEILLIDDGSTDGCFQICDEFEKIDCRIKVFHKDNEGLVRARKLGLSYSTGEYVAFVDGDDWIEPNMYSYLIDIIENSDADFIDSGYYYDKNKDFEIENKLLGGIYKLDIDVKHKIFSSLMNVDYFMGLNSSIWSKVFKADIIKSSYANVPDNMQYGEDIINYLYCVMKSKMMIQVNKSFYHYNYREESMSHSRSASLLRKEFMLWNYCGNIILKHDDLLTQKEIDLCLFHRLYSSFGYLMNQKFDTIQYYSFPCVNELFGKKIAVYGAGKVGKDYITQLSKYEKCEIVGWVDRNYKDFSYEYREVVSIEELLKKTYDVILIAVEKKEVANEIKGSLLIKGVSESKILWCKPSIPFLFEICK